MANIYYGSDAVNMVEAAEGPLSSTERRIVELEGFADGAYQDTKGITTTGVGQTGQFANMSLKDTVAAFTQEARNMVPNFDNLSPQLQTELVQAAYRGDLQQSPITRNLLNEGRYQEAAAEFLNNEEYRTTDHSQIRERMESVSNALNAEAVRLPETPTVGEQKQQQTLTTAQTKQADLAERSQDKQLQVAGMTDQEINISKVGLTEYVNQGTPEQSVERAREWLAAQDKYRATQARMEEQTQDPLFNINTGDGYAGNVALSTLNTVLNIGGGIASLPTTALATMGLSGITNEDIETYKSIVTKQAAGADLTEDEQAFMQAGVRESDSIVGQLQAGGFVGEEAGKGESKFDQISTAFGSEEISRSIQEHAGVIEKYIDTELTDEVVQSAAEAYNKWDSGETNFGEMLLGLTEAAVTNPGATGQAAIESLPYVFMAANPVGMAASVGSSWSNKQTEAIEAYEKEYGEKPTGDDLRNLTLLAGASAGLDMFGDRLVGGDALQALMKGTTLSGKASAIAGRIGLSAAGEFVAESTAAATEELAGTAGKGDVDVGQAVGAGVLGATAGGTTTGTIEAVAAGAQSETAQKAISGAKEATEKANQSDTVTAYQAAPTQAERDTIKTQAEADLAAVRKEAADLKTEIDNTPSNDGDKLAELQAKAPDIIKRRKEAQDTLKAINETPALAQGTTSISQHANKKVSAVLGSIERGDSTATPEQIERILNNSGITLTAQQRTALQGYAATETARKNIEQVGKEVIYGGNGNVGVDEWLKRGKKALAEGNVEDYNTALQGLKDFQETHGQPLQTGVAADGKRLGKTLRKRKEDEQAYMTAAVNELEGLNAAQGLTTPATTEETADDSTSDVQPTTAPVVATSNVANDTQGEVNDTTDVLPSNPSDITTTNDTQTVAEQPATEAQAEGAVVAEATPTQPTQTTYTNVEAANATEDAIANLEMEDRINGTPEYNAEAIKVLKNLGTRLANDENATIDGELEVLSENFSDGAISSARFAMQVTSLPYTPNEIVGLLDTPSAPEGQQLKDRLAGTHTGPVRSAEDVPNYQPRLRNILAKAGVTREDMSEVFDIVTERVNMGESVVKAMRETLPEYTGKPFKRASKKAKELQADIKKLDRADAQAKEASPYTPEALKSINWIKEFFVASKGTKNILQEKEGVFERETANKVSDYLGRELTPNEVLQLDDMSAVVNGLKKMFDKVYDPSFYATGKNPQYHNLMSYLTDESGNIDEAVKDAIAVAGYNWVIDGAKDTIFNDTSAVKSLLNDGTDMPLVNSLVEPLRTAGQTRTAVIDSLGKDVRKMLGISQARTASGDLNSRLERSLGLMALQLLEEANVVTVSTPEAIGLDTEAVAREYPGSTLGSTTRFVRAKAAPAEMNQKYSYEVAPRLAKMIDINKEARESAPYGEEKLLDGMFGMEKRAVFPAFKKPKGVISKVRGVSKVVPDKLIPKMLKQNQREHYTKEDNLALLDALGDHAIRALGEQDPNTVHVSQRRGVEDANEEIRRSIENLNEFRDLQREQEGGVTAPFYFQLVPWKNGRWGLAQNRVNAQTDKIQRAFIAQKGWMIDVNPNDSEVMEQFWASMDEHLGIDSEEGLKPEMQEAVAMLVDFLDNNNTFEEGGAEAFADAMQAVLALPKVSAPALVMDDLTHIAKMIIARRDNTTFRSEKFVEIDGKTNGMAITLLQYGALPERLMGAFGYYTKASGHKTFKDYTKSGGLDIYKQLAEVWEKAFRAAGEYGKYTPAQISAISDMFNLVTEGGDSDMGSWRTIAKSPLMVIFYGSGLPAVTQKVQQEYLTNMYNKISKFGQNGDLAGYNNMVKQVNSLIKNKEHHLPYMRNSNTGQDILEVQISARTEELLMNAVEGFGDIAGESVQDMFPEYMTSKEVIAEASQLMYRMQAQLREVMIAKATKEAREAGIITQQTITFKGGKTRKSDMTGLPQYMIDEIDAKLQEVAPHVFSNKSAEGEIDTAIDLSKTTTVEDTTQRVRVPLKGAKNGAQVASSTGYKRVPTAPGVGIVGVSVHNLDSEDQIETMGRDIDKSGVHDAILVGLGDAKQAGRELNEDHFATMDNNDIPTAVNDALLQAIKAYTRINLELGLDPKVQGDSLIKTKFEGESTSMAQKKTNVADQWKNTPRGIMNVLGELAYSTKNLKEVTMGSIAYVHQYADEPAVSQFETTQPKTEELKKVENAANPEAAAAKEVVKTEETAETVSEEEVLGSPENEDTAKYKLSQEQVITGLKNIVATNGNRSERGSLAAALLRGIEGDKYELTYPFPAGTTNQNWINHLSKMVEPKRPTPRQRDLHQKALRGEVLGSTETADFSTDPTDFTSTEAGIDSTNVLGVFNALPDTEGVVENKNHKEYLGGMVKTLAAKLATPFAVHMREVENNGTYGHQSGSDVFISRMMDGTEVTSGILAQGVRMSTHEVMAHELNHVVFAEGFKRDTRYRRQMERMYDAVAKAGSYEVLLDDPATASDAEIEGAQKTWNYIFSNKKGNGLAEFGAFATTNENLMNFTNTVSMKPDAFLQGENAYERIVNLLNRIIDLFNNAVLGLRNGSNTDQLMGLMSQMNNISTGKEAGIMKAANAAAGLAGKAGDALQTVGDKAITALATAIAPIPYVGPVARIINSKVPQQKKEAAVKGSVKALNQVRDNVQGTKYSLLESVLDETAGRTDNNKKAFDLRRKVGLVLDGMRKRTKDAYIRNAREGFSVKVTDKEWDALNKIVLKLDIDSISQLGVSAIGEILSNPVALQNQIDMIEAQLSASPNRNWMIRQAKNLGYFMNTNESREEFTLMNAHNIVNGHGNPFVKVSPAQAAQYEGLVDRLATLYGIKEANSAQKNAIADLIKRDKDGVQNIIFTHAHLKEAAKAQFTSENEYNVLKIKGWTKEVMAGNADVVPGTAAEHDALVAQGYIRGERIPPDSMDPTKSEPRWLYVNKNGAQAEYMAQIISLTNNVAKGADTYKTNEQYGSQTPFLSGENDNLIITGLKEKTLRQQNVTDQTPVRNGAFNPMVPIISPKTKKVVGWRYMMSETTKDNHLSKDNNASRVLGAMAANVVDKVQTEKVNREAVQTLKEYWDQEKDTRGKAYVVIGPDAQGRLGEIYAQMPEQMKSDIRKTFGGPNLYVRKDLVDVYFGNRAPSMTNLLEKHPESRKAWENILVKIMKGVTLNKNTYQRILKAENFFTGLTSEVKSRIVVQSIVVPVFNVFSNAMWLVAQGHNPITVFPKMLKAMVDSNRLGGDLRQKGQLEIELGKPGNTPARQRNIEGKLAQIQMRIDSNPVADSFYAGLMPTIVDDVATDLESDTSARGAIHRGISNGIDRVLNPEAMITNFLGQTVKSIIGTQDSVYVKTMNNFVMNTDFIGRHLHAEMNKERKAKDLGRALSAEELNDIYGTAEDAFVSFGQPTHQGLEYLNRIGVAWFTKYMLRNTGTVAKTIAREPRKMVIRMAMMHLGMGDVMGNTPVGSAIPFRNPLNVVDDPLTAALDATSLWAPLQAIN